MSKDNKGKLPDWMKGILLLYVGVNVLGACLVGAAMIPFVAWMGWESTAGREPLAEVDLLADPQAEVRVPGDKGLEFWVSLETRYTPPKAHHVLVDIESQGQVTSVRCDALNPTMRESSAQNHVGAESYVRFRRAHMRCDVEPVLGELTLSLQRELLPKSTEGLEKMEVLIYPAR